MKDHILTKPAKITNLTFDDLYAEISRDWQHKARQLQVRRWRALKHATKGNHHAIN